MHRAVEIAVLFTVVTIGRLEACFDPMTPYSVGVVFSGAEEEHLEIIEQVVQNVKSFIKICAIETSDEVHPIIETGDEPVIDPLTINWVRISDATLLINVSYSGGCQEHEIDLYTTSMVLLSNPPQKEYRLSHDANGDACEALITTELEFDLVPLRNAYQRAYDDDGPMLLRILEPGATAPVEPLILYEF